MRAAVPVANVVGEAEERLLVGIVPLHGDFHREVPRIYGFDLLDVDGRLMEGVLVAVEVLHEGVDAAGVQEIVAFPIALVRDPDVHPFVEVAEFPQALAEGLEGELQDVVEDLAIGFKPDPRSSPGCGANHRQWRIGLAPGEGHGVLLAIAPDG